MSCDYCKNYEDQLDMYSLVCSDMGPAKCPVCGREFKGDLLREDLIKYLDEMNTQMINIIDEKIGEAIL